ncbi:unnamed protein product [Meganyctiphanes norvegica]|uniref:Replication factor-A protein 1 N-terminal domain-containing protein n=1 Tax=Meganyctiphanes norvegica TaxID=48144 RepID=A0AAV2QJ09_MEGNR
MANQLIKGTVHNIIQGHNPKSPVLQVLAVRHNTIHTFEYYTLTVSDGLLKCTCAMLPQSFKGKITSGEISKYCIIQIDAYKYDEMPHFTDDIVQVMITLDLTVLQSGDDVGKLIGDPLYWPHAYELSRGALLELVHEGKGPKEPVLQILAMKSIIFCNQEYHRVFLSDGRWSSNCALISHQYSCKVFSGEISQNCIVQLNTFASQSVPETSGKVLTISHLTVLQSGVDVGRRLGNPELFHIKKWIISHEPTIIHIQATDQSPKSSDSESSASSAEPCGSNTATSLTYSDMKQSSYNIYCLTDSPYWVETFKSRGVYIREAKNLTEKNIWHNDIKKF